MSRPGARVRPRTLTGRLLLWNAIAVLAVLLVLAIVADRALERFLVDLVTESLAREGRAIEEALSEVPGARLQEETTALGAATGTRITIIRTDGLVLADSERDPATMENHLERPEVQQALGREIGRASRRSESVGTSYRYVALPAVDDRIVRLALPLDAVASRERTLRLILAVGFGAATLAGVLVVALVARGVSRPLTEIANAVRRVGEGDLVAEVPERGTEELVTLAATVNRMREDVGEQIAAGLRDRALRDAILASLDEGVALFDPEGRIVYQNDTCRALLGPIQSERNISPSALRELLGEARTRGARRGREIVVDGPPSDGPGRGSARILEVDIAPVPGGNVVLVARNVTEARELDAVRRDFVANASHELKTPVASIRALAETLTAAADDGPRDVLRFTRRLETEAIRLSRIVSDLLDLSRLESAPPDGGTTRLDRVVEHETDRFRDRARASGLMMDLDVRENVVVHGSTRDLALLVRNLIENAVQYTRPGGRIDIRLRRLDGRAALTVEDTGVGIPARDQGRVFERFYRVDRARSRETGGTGLGLSIVKHVVENLGGSVVLESALGRGSSFTVTLPLATFGADATRGTSGHGSE